MLLAMGARGRREGGGGGTAATRRWRRCWHRDSRSERVDIDVLSMFTHARHMHFLMWIVKLPMVVTSTSMHPEQMQDRVCIVELRLKKWFEKW